MRFYGLFLAFVLFLAALVQSVFGAPIDTPSLIETSTLAERHALEERLFGLGKSGGAKNEQDLPGTVYLRILSSGSPDSCVYHWEIIVQPSPLSLSATIHHAVNPHQNGPGSPRVMGRWIYDKRKVNLKQTATTWGYIELGKIQDLATVESIIDSVAGHIPVDTHVPTGDFDCKSFADEATMRLLGNEKALGKRRPEVSWTQLEAVANKFAAKTKKKLEVTKGVMNGKTRFVGLPAD